MESLTEKERATNYETMRHIERVRNLLNVFVAELMRRGEKHDQSKLASPEVELFAEFTPFLAELTYGSEEYNAVKAKLGPALEHHYANNSHHIEHFDNGINDMNLVDIIEMFCDWKAASERHNNGNIRKSLAINGSKHHINQQLLDIFENTIPLVGG